MKIRLWVLTKSAISFINNTKEPSRARRTQNAERRTQNAENFAAPLNRVKSPRGLNPLIVYFSHVLLVKGRGCPYGRIPAFYILLMRHSREGVFQMKRFLVLGVLLGFGFVLVSCAGSPNSGESGTAPTITSITTVEMTVNSDRSPNFGNSKTTFAINEWIGTKYTFTDPDKDVKGHSFTVKKDGKIFSTVERDYSRLNNNSTSATVDYMAYRTFAEAGAYTYEVYVFDLKGNKSNTVTASITVR